MEAILEKAIRPFNESEVAGFQLPFKMNRIDGQLKYLLEITDDIERKIKERGRCIERIHSFEGTFPNNRSALVEEIKLIDKTIVGLSKHYKFVKSKL